MHKQRSLKADTSNSCTHQQRKAHCKPGPYLNSYLTQGGRKWLNSVKYASPGAHLSQEKQRNRKVRMNLMWSIFDSAVPHSTLWSQMRVEVGTGLTVQVRSVLVHCRYKVQRIFPPLSPILNYSESVTCQLRWRTEASGWAA
jgi:hypothetical protein